MPQTFVVSCGDPGGIGPEVAARAIAIDESGTGFVIFGDASRFNRLLKETRPGSVAAKVRFEGDCTWQAADRHQFDAENGCDQIVALRDAATHAFEHRLTLLTGPTSKEAVTAHYRSLKNPAIFRGQTGFLARHFGLQASDVTMLFLGPRLRTGLVTTHCALSEVSKRVTEESVLRTLTHLGQAHAGLGGKKVYVPGLNPHAGEGGLFGNEENVIRDAIDAYKNADPLVDVIGPIASEAAFRKAVDEREAVLAIYHDQATIASKLLDWGKAVNVTWGLPILRVSVDHGVAYDIAGTGKANADGFVAAIEWADRLTPIARRYCDAVRESVHARDA